jgi:general secretion pathway protein G
MIIRVNRSNRGPAFRRREAFTLLEVLVVVAILVVLASVAGIYVFRFLEDSRVDATRLKMQALDRACKSYALKNGGSFPENLQMLVTPPDQGEPFVDGADMILDSWGNPINYEIRQYATGEIGPFFSTVTPKGQTVFWPQRQ